MTRLALLVAATLTVALAPNAGAQPKSLDRDTPADVQLGSANAVAEIDKAITRMTGNRATLVQQRSAPTALVPIDAQLVALKEARAAFSRIARDGALAARVLDAARKNDMRGIVTMVKVDAPQSEVLIDNIKDWTATLSFKVRNYKVTICGSSENGCGGGKASVTVT